MKFRTTTRFDVDFWKLKPEHKKTFKSVVVSRFAAACDAWAQAQASGTGYVWPKSLRVSMLRGAHGVMEMTWSFASPDGRATFQLVREDGEWICVWRRIGDHDVFIDP